MKTTLRVAVIGGGLIAQAIHLPNLSKLPNRYHLAAIADPSQKVCDALQATYPSCRTYLDWSDLLVKEHDLDAVLVCSPAPTHAEIVLDAIDHGLHVLVEKPLCITVADAEKICNQAASAPCVVQVGYMKRYSRAYHHYLQALPTDDELTMLDILTYDPWMAREPFVPWSRMIVGSDVPTSVREQLKQSERDQVAHAIGTDDPAAVRAYGYTYLGCLIHDVNLGHGILDRLAITGSLQPYDSSAWGDGHAAAATVLLPNKALWRMAWMLLPGLLRFEEVTRSYFQGAIHGITFPAPYLTTSPISVSACTGTDTRSNDHLANFVEDPFLAELNAFHAAVVDGADCKTPPQQACRDLQLLQDLYLAGGEPSN